MASPTTACACSPCSRSSTSCRPPAPAATSTAWTWACSSSSWRSTAAHRCSKTTSVSAAGPPPLPGGIDGSDRDGVRGGLGVEQGLLLWNLFLICTSVFCLPLSCIFDVFYINLLKLNVKPCLNLPAKGSLLTAEITQFANQADQ